VLGAAASCELVLGDLPPVQGAFDGGAEEGGCCDCDGDGYASEALCAANDCDDHDPLVHPGQTTYFATASQNPNVGFDYDCSGAPDPEFPSPIDCSAIHDGNCDAGAGFLGSVPPCGATGAWGTCVSGSVPLSCTQHVIDANKVSRCR
jgi:hypothetical protein